MCLAQGHNAVTPARLEPAALRSRIKHSTTEPLRSLLHLLFFTFCKNTIPKVFADSDDHKKFECLKYSTVVFLKDPIRRTVFF